MRLANPVGRIRVSQIRGIREPSRIDVKAVLAIVAWRALRVTAELQIDDLVRPSQKIPEPTRDCRVRRAAGTVARRQGIHALARTIEPTKDPARIIIVVECTTGRSPNHAEQGARVVTALDLGTLVAGRRARRMSGRREVR